MRQDAPPNAQLPAPRSSPVEDIARAYLVTAQGDAEAALHAAISDALADICEAERRTRRQDRLISRGYVRAALHETVR
ncbi:hypothetical protein Mchl_4081 [Methylorubrum extorquens CM4]|uniref:Uncharacterized protein n=1 Tax=Methylorubrum extorquens (strain CM4 / NCIMB 13688) TaxID=440085 RepID=B7KZU9_METC4|nr:hypothetical protein [Methylorubrum extorquens]ACK84880.1 hypothetical protein Mchl_4081 [Methylorubrum extorquens CM4]